MSGFGTDFDAVGVLGYDSCGQWGVDVDVGAAADKNERGLRGWPSQQPVSASAALRPCHRCHCFRVDPLRDYMNFIIIDIDL